MILYMKQIIHTQSKAAAAVLSGTLKFLGYHMNY